MKKILGVGVGVIVKKDGKILLIKRKGVHGDGTWSTPGGHLDFGENPEECGVREVKEETGLEVSDLKFIGITNDIFSNEDKHYITIWMEGFYISGEPTVRAFYEASEVGWYSLDDLPKPLFLSLSNLLEGNYYKTTTNSINGIK